MADDGVHTSLDENQNGQKCNDPECWIDQINWLGEFRQERYIHDSQNSQANGR